MKAEVDLVIGLAGAALVPVGAAALLLATPVSIALGAGAIALGVGSNVAGRARWERAEP